MPSPSAALTPTKRNLIVAAWIVAGIVAGLQAWGGLSRPLPDRLSDMQVYLGAVGDLWGGGSLYDFAAQNGAAPFTYPPFAGLVFAVLHWVPFTPMAVIWEICTFAVVVGIAVVVARRAEITFLDRRVLAPLLALVLFASAPISSNFRFGQISVFLVAAVLVDALQLASPRWRGIATGIAGAIKLTPMVFVPYYWFSGQRRTAIVSTITFVVCSGLGWLVLPGDSVRFWFTEIWDVNRVGNIATGGNQSLNGAMLRWGLPEGARTAAAVIGLIVVAVALYRASLAYRQNRLLLAAVTVGAAGLVLSPVSWTHHQVWLVLGALLVVGASRALMIGWSVLVLLVMIVPVTSLGSALGDEVVLGNARLWLAVALAAVVPAILRPAGNGTAPPAGRSGGSGHPSAVQEGASTLPQRRTGAGPARTRDRGVLP
ncbi:glycosyltransferase 87 family protein [Actinoplanes teichomyceticus]|uniref:Alpha-1,2-mannosyltransferase n=1 Tax=Actinoplanes teichomyceticus TaxID=1867 RepID=A0A561WSB0_ACTTI|nr:glycosyltransferase 87 family protein [Actinoplanes teichomyceticus]TWG26742.1 alpha-1,2-mannosyltransferase [Actinoplanes teichomyceticus]GIF15141.1 hypothetical protein Ate01nite_51730 [Actinoplanes teichomyceticus]